MKFIHEVAGDGNCLYNSIAYGILFRENGVPPKKKQYKELSKLLRELMVERMRNYVTNGKVTNSNVIDTLYLMSGSQLEETSSNSNNNLPDVLSIDKLKQLSLNYINRMSKNCEWGGHLEIKFLNELLKVHFNYRGLVVYDANTLEKWGSLQVPLKRSGKDPITIVHIEDLHFDYLEITKASMNKNNNGNVKVDAPIRHRGSFPKI